MKSWIIIQGFCLVIKFSLTFSLSLSLYIYIYIYIDAHTFFKLELNLLPETTLLFDNCNLLPPPYQLINSSPCKSVFLKGKLILPSIK